MSYQARIVSSRSQGPVYLLLSDSQEGMAKWFYLQVSALREPAFLHALQREDWDCAEYGQVLASGYGSRPPAHVSRELKATGAL